MGLGGAGADGLLVRHEGGAIGNASAFKHCGIVGTVAIGNSNVEAAGQRVDDCPGDNARRDFYPLNLDRPCALR